jgi:hypothetical protein
MNTRARGKGCSAPVFHALLHTQTITSRRFSMRLYAFGLLCLLASGSLGIAQDEGHPAETAAQVPALTQFHTVIYEIWHGAWPKKDIEKLKALLPKVEAGVQEIDSATLPGILRERNAAWKAGVQSLNEAVLAYREGVEKKDSVGLLNAAEQLHMRYEQLVRVIRPPLKELEAFHADLYMLYHYYMPGDSVAKMQEAALALKDKMKSLAAATLPARLKEKEEAFNAARKELGAAVDAFAAIAPNGDAKEMHSAIVRVHDRYQKLDDLLTK